MMAHSHQPTLAPFNRIAVCAIVMLFSACQREPVTTPAKDTVAEILGRISRGEIVQPEGKSIAGGWEMPLLDTTVSRSALQNEAGPIIALGRNAVPELLNWVNHPERAVRYVAIYSTEQITGIQGNVPVFGDQGPSEEVIGRWRNWMEIGDGDGDAVQPHQAAVQCGVDSMSVEWEGRKDGSYVGRLLRIDTWIDFTNGAGFDPACCGFRQNVKTVWSLTTGEGGDTSPMHDDGYSRADDTDGQPELSHEGFTTNDNPGITDLDDADVLDYEFTAEQIVFDICNGDTEVAKKGPHAATVQGAHPRQYGGVPVTL